MPDIHQRVGKSPAVPFSAETAGPAFVQKIARESKKLLHNEQEPVSYTHLLLFQPDVKISHGNAPGSLPHFTHRRDDGLDKIRA